MELITKIFRQLVKEEEPKLWEEMKEAGVGGIFSKGGGEVTEVTCYRFVWFASSVPGLTGRLLVCHSLFSHQGWWI